MKLLREYLRLVLSEAARPIGDLALDSTIKYTSTGGKGVRLTLWNPKAILILLEMTQDPKEVLYELADSTNVFAFMELQKHTGDTWNAWEVTASVAQRGYGPTMYDIAMSKLKRITSDRDTVSAAAEKVWNFYSSNRPNVKKLPFDNKHDPKTPPPDDDAVIHHGMDALNNAYEGVHVDTASAEQRSRSAIAQVSEALKVDAKDVLEALHTASWNFFDQSYELED